MIQRRNLPSLTAYLLSGTPQNLLTLVYVFLPFLNVSFKNYVTLKSKIQANFQRWSSLKLTLQGRIVLSKDEYTWAFTLAFSPPKDYFTDMQRMTSKFIRNNKKPCIKFDTLKRPKSLGGLSLPDFKLYYWSF